MYIKDTLRSIWALNQKEEMEDQENDSNHKQFQDTQQPLCLGWVIIIHI